jgi:tRNA pseudouridine55 synthase
MAKRKSGIDLNGILLLDKQSGVSSNGALQQVRKLLNANKAGHTGSLDPLATGLLPLCFGEATKVSSLMLDDDKTYQVTVQLGTMTDTGDLEGQIINTLPTPPLSEERLQNALLQFTGDILQVPPMYSALKKDGKKLYELAREGKTVERTPRPVTIYSIKLSDFSDQHLDLEVHCSKGTYIRSLAEDISHALDTCGTVSRLRRIAAGGFHLNDAMTFEMLQKMDHNELRQQLLPVDQPLQYLPSIHLTQDKDVECIRHGQEITVEFDHEGMIRMYGPDQFLGLGLMLKNGKLAPKRVFNLNES